MQLACPECTARYLVKPDSIGPEGRRVKCARCGHIWRAEPPPESLTPEAEIVEALNEELQVSEAVSATENAAPNLPVPADIKKPAPAWLKAAALLLLCVAMALAFVAHTPSMRQATLLSWLYELFGMGATDGLVLADIKVTSQEEGDGMHLYISGVIRNDAGHEQPMPMLQLQLLDAAGGVMRSEQFVRKETILPPGESLPFNTELTVSTEQHAERMILDIGSRFDIGLRD